MVGTGSKIVQLRERGWTGSELGGLKVHKKEGTLHHEKIWA